jgi:hypothetical protein
MDLAPAMNSSSPRVCCDGDCVLRASRRSPERSNMRGWLAVLIFVSACYAAAAADKPTVTAAAEEHQLKAAGFYNLILYTEFPATAFASSEAPLVIGVMEQGPVALMLQEMTRNETWHGRRIVLQQCRTGAEMKMCHVIYLSGSGYARWPAMRQEFAGRPILTVGDGQTFARDGGVVQLGLDQNQLKLVVNLAAVRQAGLTISSKVLRLSEIMGDVGQ